MAQALWSEVLIYYFRISSRGTKIFCPVQLFRIAHGFGPLASDLVEPDRKPEAQGPRSRGTRGGGKASTAPAESGVKRKLVAAGAALGETHAPPKPAGDATSRGVACGPLVPVMSL